MDGMAELVVSGGIGVGVGVVVGVAVRSVWGAWFQPWIRY